MEFKTENAGRLGRGLWGINGRDVRNQSRDNETAGDGITPLASQTFLQAQTAAQHGIANCANEVYAQGKRFGEAVQSAPGTKWGSEVKDIRALFIACGCAQMERFASASSRAIRARARLELRRSSTR